MRHSRENIKRAIELRRRGMSLRKIEKATGIPEAQVRYHCNPEYRKRKLLADKLRRELAAGATVGPDPRAIAERDRRMAVWPADRTAWFCGDPPPGYSALDRRRGA